MAPKTTGSFEEDSVVLNEVRKADTNGDVMAQKSSMPQGKEKSTDHRAVSSSQPQQQPSFRENTQRQQSSSLLPWVGFAVWPLMLLVPLVLAYSPYSYDVVFPEEWYIFDGESHQERPKPLGLCLGIIAVGIGQIFVLCYFYLHSHGCLLATTNTVIGKARSPSPIQRKGAPKYNFMEGVQVHLSQPEGFVLLATYLSVTWMCHWMPAEYYSFEGGIQWGRLALCLMSQDCIQYLMHLCEHNVSAKFYQFSHKPHHKFTNPRLFDAFNGSFWDTIIMILIPLYSTALLVHCNVWTYMAFGSMYANWLTLIHSEFPLPWDKAFRRFGLGTPGDHHIHHKLFKFNFGHLFMWWDRLAGTYRSPMEYPTIFSAEV